MSIRTIKVHVFNNYGQYEGYVLREDLTTGPTPEVRISRKVRSTCYVTGRGWCVFLPSKAKIPADIRGRP